MKNNKNLNSLFLAAFGKFENIITVILSCLIGLIIIVSLVRVCENFYMLFINDFFEPNKITFQDYQEVFGKIMTLIISLEFMSSILKVLKSHEIKTLVQDVILITALAIARKLIIFDYDQHDPVETIVFGGLLVSIGVFYFLVRFSHHRLPKSTNGKQAEAHSVS